jgi:hypothetical protein
MPSFRSSLTCTSAYLRSPAYHFFNLCELAYATQVCIATLNQRTRNSVFDCAVSSGSSQLYQRTEMASPPLHIFAEELTAIQAIYGPDFNLTSQTPTNTAISITLESQPFSFLLSIGGGGGGPPPSTPRHRPPLATRLLPRSSRRPSLRDLVQ